MSMEIATEINKICGKREIPFIFKASYKKANRSRIDSFTGIGDIKALEIIQDLGKTLNIPVVTDIHSPEDACNKYISLSLGCLI